MYEIIYGKSIGLFGRGTARKVRRATLTVRRKKIPAYEPLKVEEGEWGLQKLLTNRA
jgi:hypothetical protein